MNRNRATLLVVILALVGVVALKGSRDEAPAAGEATGGAAEQATAAAQAAGQPVFLCFRSGVTMEGHCIPCVEMARLTAELAPKYQGRVAFIDVSLDDNTTDWGLLEKYEVRVKPTSVLLDRRGQVVEQRLGVWPAEALTARLDEVCR